VTAAINNGVPSAARRRQELQAIEAAIAAGRLHRITPAEAAAHRAAREATAAARRRSVGMFFRGLPPRTAAQG